MEANQLLLLLKSLISSESFFSMSIKSKLIFCPTLEARIKEYLLNNKMYNFSDYVFEKIFSLAIKEIEEEGSLQIYDGPKFNWKLIDSKTYKSLVHGDIFHIEFEEVYFNEDTDEVLNYYVNYERFESGVEVLDEKVSVNVRLI